MLCQGSARAEYLIIHEKKFMSIQLFRLRLFAESGILLSGSELTTAIREHNDITFIPPSRGWKPPPLFHWDYKGRIG
jgi:hypothetical protein